MTAWELTKTGRNATGRRQKPGNKKPLSSLSAGAHQPTGAVLWAIIRIEDFSSTTDKQAQPHERGSNYQGKLDSSVGGLSRIRPVSGQFLGWLAKIVADVFPSTSLRISRLQEISPARHPSAVAANSATGLGNPMESRRNSAPITFAGVFFVCYPVYGGCAWEAFGPAGFLDSRFTNLRTAATHSLGNERGSSSIKEVEKCAASIRTKFAF